MTLKPALHGRDHCPGGADPIPCLPNAAGATTYVDLVLEHPCLAHYWPADETSGNLADRVGSWDLVPTVHNSEPTYGEPGPLPGLPAYTAVANSGTQGVGAADQQRFEYAYGSPPSFWTGTNEFTIEFWLKLDSYATSGTSYFFQVTGSSPSFYLYSPTGPFQQLQFSRSGLDLIDPDDLPLDQWHHIAATYDGDELILYRNGAVVDSVTGAGGFTVSSGELAWLNSSLSGTPTWNPTNGSSAHLALYNCALTAAEIGQHLTAAAASGDSPEGNVLTADGAGGFAFRAPTVDVEGTRYERILAGTGITATDNADDTVTLSAASFDPADATTWWFPLADSDGTLVLDADDAIIPTLIPL